MSRCASLIPAINLSFWVIIKFALHRSSEPAVKFQIPALRFVKVVYMYIFRPIGGFVRLVHRIIDRAGNAAKEARVVCLPPINDSILSNRVTRCLHFEIIHSGLGWPASIKFVENIAYPSARSVDARGYLPRGINNYTLEARGSI